MTASEAKAIEKEPAPKCDCHLHEYQVCDICQGVTGNEVDVEPAQVESGDGLPPRIWIASHVAGTKSGTLSRGLLFRSIHDSKQEAEDRNGRHRGLDEIGFSAKEYVKADELKASLQREKDLRELLRDAGRYIAGACSGTRETILLQRIKAAVTGE